MDITTLDKNNYIIIGKYWILKCAFISDPYIINVINSDSGECTLYMSLDKVYNTLRNEELDIEPLVKYVNIIYEYSSIREKNK